MGIWRSGSVLVGSVLMVSGLVGACGGSDGAGIGAVDAGGTSLDSGTPPPVQTATKAAATVGNSGGKVTTTDGVGVEIPAGALPNNVQVTVDASPTATPPAQAVTLGTPHVFGPSGLQFTKPVTVVLEFDPTKLPAGKTGADIVVFTAPEGTTNYVALPTKVRDATHVEAETTHFSVMVPTIPEATVADAGASGGDDAGTTCKPRLCGASGPGTCGTQDDGCGNKLDCGSCPTQTDAGSGSGGNDASAPPDSGTSSCQNPLSCSNYEQAAGQPLCGTYDDGCGNKMFCGDGCQSGGDGGGSGSTDASAPAPDGGTTCQPAPVQCAPTDCTTKFDGCKDVGCFGGCDGGSGGGGGTADASAPLPDGGKTCQPTPVQCSPTDCTTKFDGCNTIDCFEGCSSDAGGGGGAVDAGAACVPMTPAQACGGKCGVVPDGCGSSLDCGPCQ
jgi:hypothetical protein